MDHYWPTLALVLFFFPIGFNQRTRRRRAIRAHCFSQTFGG